LQEEIKSQDFSSFAQKLMAEHAPSEPGTNPDFEPGEAHQELRLLLNMMLMDRLKELETEALKAVETSQDPEALNRWRALQQRRRTLMNS
jgi:DNA primase